MKRLYVLVACEESQAVCKAFRELGHRAFSCDLQPCSGGHPEWHFQCDVTQILDPTSYSAKQFFKWLQIPKWDLIIAHPPCTYMCIGSAARMYPKKGLVDPERYEKAIKAREFFMNFFNAECKHIALENPQPLKLIQLPKYTQVVQPYEYGDPYTKKTCLWLKGLPELKPTQQIPKELTVPFVNGGSKREDGTQRKRQGKPWGNGFTRSKTFPGIAKAMAKQWSEYILRTDYGENR